MVRVNGTHRNVETLYNTHVSGVQNKKKRVALNNDKIDESLESRVKKYSLFAFTSSSKSSRMIEQQQQQEQHEEEEVIDEQDESESFENTTTTTTSSRIRFFPTFMGEFLLLLFATLLVTYAICTDIFLKKKIKMNEKEKEERQPSNRFSSEDESSTKTNPQI